jgi:diguanylate cyclase (GGDEF)-like protein
MRESVKQRLKALQERFRLQLPHRLHVLEQALAACRSDDADGAARDELLRCVHNLAGSAGSFGFPELSERARALEAQLRVSPEDLASSWASVDIALGTLRELASRSPAPVADVPTPAARPSASAPSGALAPMVYLLEDDPLQAQELSTQLGHFGYRTESFVTAADFTAALRRTPPVAAVVDMLVQGDRRGGARVVHAMRGTEGDGVQDLPVVFVSAEDDWGARLQAVQAGGRAYLAKPVDVSALVEQLDRLTGRTVEQPYKVLIVDDMDELAQHYGAVLEGAGMEARVLTQVEGLLESFDDFQPDLVLMDLYMPTCPGTEVAQVLRQHPVFRNVPVVYLSTEAAVEAQLAALRVGGDDFLTKPIKDENLIDAVRIRAARFRELLRLVSRDSLTGLLNHIHLKLALERELVLAERRGGSLSVVMLDIDHFKRVNDTYGHPVGDRVIKGLARLLVQRVRRTDIAARYGGEEFAILLVDTPAESARETVDSIRAQFAEIHHAHAKGEFNCTLSAGIAQIPGCTDIQTVLVAADAALYEAKHAGRNRVVVSEAG